MSKWAIFGCSNQIDTKNVGPAGKCIYHVHPRNSSPLWFSAQRSNQPTTNRTFRRLSNGERGVLWPRVPMKHAGFLRESLGNHKKSLRIPTTLEVLESPHLNQDNLWGWQLTQDLTEFLDAQLGPLEPSAEFHVGYSEDGSLNTQKVGNVKKKHVDFGYERHTYSYTSCKFIHYIYR